MVETSSPKPTSKVADNNKQISSYKVKLVKGTKPLLHHKFYLDIEKHKTATNIENKIKELGGSIEFFLHENITHFITDKQEKPLISNTIGENKTTDSSNFPPNPRTPASFSDVHNVSSSLPSTETRVKNLNNKTISRADAILLRARRTQLDTSPNSSRANRESPCAISYNTKSPIQVAQSWRRPIWTTEYAQKFLEKVSLALKLSNKTTTAPETLVDNNNGVLTYQYKHRHNQHHKSSAKVKSLRGDFIKIETLDKRYRPFYQELKRWPKINLEARLTHSAFESELDNCCSKGSHESKFKKFSKLDSRTNTTSKFKTVGTIMTRKSRPSQQQDTEVSTTANNTIVSRVINKSANSDNKHCGYCEICHVEYDVLKLHLKSEQHLNFSKNNDNFVSLDKLIDSGANVQKFLKLNEVKREKIVNGYLNRSNKKITYLKNGDSEKEESGEECEKNGIVGSNSEEERVEELDEDPLSLDPPRPKRKCMHSPTFAKNQSNKEKREKKINLENNTHKVIDSKIQATRIRGLRWNAPSPESRPPIKDPPVYKIEKSLNSKQNSNCSSKTKVSSTDVNGAKQVIVKLKRVRQSELNLLNNEAEQFMFPKTPTVTDSDTDEDRQSSEVNRTNNTTFDLQSSEQDSKRSSIGKSKIIKDSISQKTVLKKSNSSPSSKRVNKRLEALIEENSKYTHESLGRMRFQETPIQSLVTVNTATHLIADDRMGDNSFLKSPGGTTQSRWINFKNKYQAVDMAHKFNFERIPHNEPWYLTFQRQDIGVERTYEYFGNSAYCKLPFELGPLPQGKDDCCKLEELIPPAIKGANTSSKKRGTSCPRMPSIAKVNDRTRSSTAAIIEATRFVDANDDTTNDSIKSKSYLPLKKRKLFLDDVPRKSPREHASTLAILSSMSKEGSSITSSVSGVNRSGMKRERLPSQFSFEDDDENSNCTMTSQQTSKTVVTEKDNSSVSSITNNIIHNRFTNIVKLCKQVDDMLVSGIEEFDDDSMFDSSVKHCIPNDKSQCETDGESFVLLNSKVNDIGISEVIDICSTQELTLKSVASKEKELQRKITYTSKPKLVTSGFRFNKKRKNNRTGWPIRRKLSQQKDNEPHDKCETDKFEGAKNEDKNKNLTPDIFAVSSDSLDTNIEGAEKTKDNIAVNGTSYLDSESEASDEQKKSTLKSPIKTSKPNVYCRGVGKYQFEKYPKINLTQISMSNIKTRSSDLQKRKSITPKKYTDAQNTIGRPPGSSSSPQKFSPRKLRKPRGRWYRER